MTEEDRRRWDDRYAGARPAEPERPGLPSVFEPFADRLPHAGFAIDVACGRGRIAVWLARRGLTVWGVDVSPVAVTQARELAAQWGVADRCRFDVADLDQGLPDGPPAGLIVCHRFRDARLDRAVMDRLAEGGILAISVLSEVDAAPGRFRVPPGELLVAFADLDVVAAGEGGGEAWLLAVKGQR